MFGQLLPNKNEQVHVATVLPEISRRKLGDQLNEALLSLQPGLTLTCVIDAAGADPSVRCCVCFHASFEMRGLLGKRRSPRRKWTLALFVWRIWRKLEEFVREKHGFG